MRIAIILNGISRKRQFFLTNIYPAVKKRFNAVLFETAYSGHATELARQATDQQFDMVICAGGDGTLHHVLNGLMLSSISIKPILGLYPLGSANDFARAVGLTSSVDQLIKLIQHTSYKLVDIGEVSCVDNNKKPIVRYFINACSLGMGPLVVERLERNRKNFGASLSYLVSILVTFFTHKPQQITCKTDTWQWHGKARVASFANGVSFGNGIYIAPDALPTDGLLNSFIAEDVPLMHFLFYLQTIKAKKKIVNERIKYKTVSTVALTSEETCMLEAEGELIGYLPASIKIRHQLIRFLH